MTANHFPKIKFLDDFLGKLTVIEPGIKTNFASEVISESMRTSGIDSQGKEITGFSREMKIWYQVINGFGLEQLISIVSERLEKSGHLIDRQSVLSVIGLYTILRSSTTLTADFFFETIDNSIYSSVALFFILPRLPAKQTYPPFSFGSYTVREIDLRYVRKLCHAAKATYIEFYESKLRGRDAIFREFHNVPLINWIPLYRERQVEFDLITSKMQLFEELRENYFANLHRLLYWKFFDEMFEQQELLFSLGNTYLDERPLRYMQNITSLVIFENVNGNGSLGYVTSQIMSRKEIDFKQLSEGISEPLEWLKSKYNLTELGNFPIHRTIKIFVSFLAKAKRHHIDNNPDEAFLHYAIALDLIFGEINKSTDSVSMRVAALTYHFADTSFRDHIKLIKSLYDARSKYVHEGRKVKKEQLDKIQTKCLIVLGCLLTLQNDEKYRSTFEIDYWLKNLDILATTLNAEKEPSEDLCLECGIPIGRIL